MKTVYLVNISYGVAGAEKRFANIWRELLNRNVVNAVLVIPEILKNKLALTGLLPFDDHPNIIAVKEYFLVHRIVSLFPFISHLPYVFGIRRRLVTLKFRKILNKLNDNYKNIVHFGLPCNLLPPPDLPLVFECVDSTFKCFNRIHYRRASKLPAIVHCQTNRIKKAIDSIYSDKSIVRWQTIVNPCCFAFYPDNKQRQDSNAEKIDILFMGRFSDEKSPLLFIHSIAILRDRGLIFNAYMLGEGPLFSKIQRLIKEYELGPFLKVAFSNDTQVYLNKAKIFVSLQTEDNYPSQSLLEAMGAGCAVIASDVGETWKIVDEAVGYRVGLDASHIADAIEKLISDRSTLDRCCSEAALRVRTHFSSNAYVSYIESIYDMAYNKFIDSKNGRQNPEHE